MDSEVTHVHMGQVPDDDEISLLNLASVLLRRGGLIILSTFAGALIALVPALRTPLEYTATTTFLPNAEGETGFSGLAQQFGFALPRSGGVERNSVFYQNLLQSREILSGVVTPGIEVVTPTGVTTVDLVDRFE